MTSYVGSLGRVQDDTCNDIVCCYNALITEVVSALTFAGPDISPTLLRLLLQQLGLEAGQSDLWRGETLELGLLQDRKGLQIGTGIVTTGH